MIPPRLVDLCVGITEIRAVQPQRLRERGTTGVEIRAATKPDGHQQRQRTPRPSNSTLYNHEHRDISFRAAANRHTWRWFVVWSWPSRPGACNFSCQVADYRVNRVKVKK